MILGTAILTGVRASPGGAAVLGEPPRPSHISKRYFLRPTRPNPRSSNFRIDRGAQTHRAPNHISKMVLSTVHFGPPTCTVDRTVFELWLGGL